MTTLGAVLVHGPVSPAFYAQATELGLVARRAPLPTADLWIQALGGTSDDTLAAAKQISRRIDGRVIALYARDDLDIYVLAEARAGEVVRRLLYVRDDGGWKLTGTSQPWESDFHFAERLDDLVLWVTGNAWSASDVEATRAAYQAHDLSRLPHRPPPRMHQLIAYVKKLGFDWEAGPHAEWSPPGFLGRLLGI